MSVVLILGGAAFSSHLIGSAAFSVLLLLDGGSLLPLLFWVVLLGLHLLLVVSGTISPRVRGERQHRTTGSEEVQAPPPERRRSREHPLFR